MLWLPGEPKSRNGSGPVIYSGLFLFLFIANYTVIDATFKHRVLLFCVLPICKRRCCKIESCILSSAVLLTHSGPGLYLAADVDHCCLETSCVYRHFSTLYMERREY